MQTKTLMPNDAGIDQAVVALRGGDLVAIPTETVYGLAAVATNEEAVAKVFQVKGRPRFDPLIVHVPAHWNTPEALIARGILSEVGFSTAAKDLTKTLMDRFWPGPLTIVLPRGPKIPDLVTNGLSSVAVRMPAHPVAQKLLAALDEPLSAPSANRFGRISPTSASAVTEELDGSIPIILDGGACEHGVESTVVAVDEKGSVSLLRPGALTREAIERVIGQSLARGHAAEAIQVSPGMLKSHYAPTCPLVQLDKPAKETSAEVWRSWQDALQGRPWGVILTSGATADVAGQLAEVMGGPVEVQSLSESGDDGEAARQLFAVMRAMDQKGLAMIFVEPCPSENGLWLAIADRLNRASKR